MACHPDSPGHASPSVQKRGTMMHQRSWRTLIAGGAALAVGVTLTAFGAPAHAAGIPGITSEARAQDEVMNYAVNLTDDASRYDFNAAVSKASENGVVLAQYPEFNTFFVQSVKAAFAPTLGKSLVDAGISYQSIGPTRDKTVTGSEVRTEQPQTTASEANAAGTHHCRRAQRVRRGRRRPQRDDRRDQDLERGRILLPRVRGLGV